jgi:hypothetical protein
MSGSNYLGRAGAYALHKRYPSGSQTQDQLKAERLNLIKARQARGLYHHTRSAAYRGFKKPSLVGRGNIAAIRIYRRRDLGYLKNRTLGIKYIRFSERGKLPKLRISGINHKFRPRISSSRYFGRTAWGAARGHSFKKRLTKRGRRLKQLKRWKYRGKRYTPR